MPALQKKHCESRPDIRHAPLRSLRRGNHSRERAMIANANENACSQAVSMLTRKELQQDLRQQAWRFLAAVIATAIILRALKHVLGFFGLPVSSDASPARFLLSTSIGIIVYIASICGCWNLVFTIGRKRLRCPLCGESILNSSSTLYHGRCVTCGKTICENSLPAEPTITKLLPMNHAKFRREIKRWSRCNPIVISAAVAAMFAIFIAGAVWSIPLATALHASDGIIFAIFSCLGLVAFFIAISLGIKHLAPKISCPHCGKAVWGATEWMRVSLFSACPYCNTRILPDEPPPQVADSFIHSDQPHRIFAPQSPRRNRVNHCVYFRTCCTCFGFYSIMRASIDFARSRFCRAHRAFPDNPDAHRLRVAGNEISPQMSELQEGHRKT